MHSLPLFQDYVSSIQEGKGESGSKYSARYIGSMCGDVHRTLLYGGIFGYPATQQIPNGKLRLLYEAAPMSFICEQAGGLSLTGKNRIMDIQPQTVHQRVSSRLAYIGTYLLTHPLAHRYLYSSEVTMMLVS